MVASYIHHVAAWMDGTESLSDGEYRVYHVVCQLIYLNNGPIVLHESGIAGRCNQHVLAFRRHLAKLIEAGKLMIGANGKLSNKRAESELQARVKPSVNPPQTPARPPPDPTPTPRRPPRGNAAKSLISGSPALAAESRALSLTLEAKDLESEVRKKVRGESAKGEKLPAGWHPTREHYEQGKALGFSAVTVNEFADRMRNWADANAHRAVARKSDWNAAFRNWLADKSERNGGGSNAASGPRGGGFSSLAAQIRNAKPSGPDRGSATG